MNATEPKLSSTGTDAPSPALSRFRRGAVVSAILRLASVGLAFVVFVALARVMSPREFGAFSGAYALGLILGYVATVGQQVAIQRFWPSLDEAYGPGAAGAALRHGLLLTLSGSCGVLILVAASSALGASAALGASWATLAWTGVFASLAAVTDFASNALRARGAMLLALLPRDVAWRLIALCAVLLQTQDVNAETAMAIMSLSLLASCLPQLLVIVADVWKHRHEHIPTEERRKLLSAGWGLWASSCVNPVAAHAGTVVVALALGPVAAGAFFAADRLAKLTGIALEGMERSSAPILARSYHASRMDEVRMIVSRTSAMALAAAVAGAVTYLVLGHVALSLFDATYVSAYPVLLILCVGQLTNAACGSNAMLLNMAGRERDMLAIRVFWAALSLPGTYLAAVHFGLLGAALASAGAVIGWNLTAVLVCRARFGFWTLPVDAIAAGYRTLLKLR